VSTEGLRHLRSRGNMVLTMMACQRRGGMWHFSSTPVCRPHAPDFIAPCCINRACIRTSPPLWQPHHTTKFEGDSVLMT